MAGLPILLLSGITTVRLLPEQGVIALIPIVFNIPAGEVSTNVLMDVRIPIALGEGAATIVAAANRLFLAVNEEEFRPTLGTS